ncbi:MAG: hypothetical protein KF831_03250 [Acidobacteria bacterium]|nr:hypothetical protein [Acidobacteriota bacterium]
MRAVANSNGHVVARTDHQAFGEEIGVGVGMRRVEQGYSADRVARQGYGLTENDAASGQQHTWFRKLETQGGRWTSPDPYKGSMNIGDPQSFNRYAYVSGDPVNFIDPSGLVGEYNCTGADGNCWVWIFAARGGGVSGSRTLGGLPVSTREAQTKCYGSGCGGGNGKAKVLGNDLDKLKKRAECQEDFVNKVIDATVDNMLMQGALAAAAIIAIKTGAATGGAVSVIAALGAVVGSAFISARTIYRIYAADRDRRICINRIG